MKIMTLLGTRPEIIRLSRVIPLLDRHARHLLVHTGQNYDERLSRIFFDDLRLRAPDEQLQMRGDGFGAQMGYLLPQVEALLLRHLPDRLLILGDTNSGLAAIVARRLGLPVYHLEAGNRCFDDRVPEEVNRRLIDHASTVLMPYTERSRDHLLREGFAHQRILVTGNPIKQVLDYHAPDIAASQALEHLALCPGGYFLASFHRAENVDHEGRLRDLLGALNALHARHGLPVVVSCHPRTRARLAAFGLEQVAGAGVRLLAPLGFFDFVRLERDAFCVLSDSGTVQEECALFGVPTVTTREVTERPETVECGANFLAGTDPQRILDGVALVTERRGGWQPPAEYLAPAVAETVARILLGHQPADGAALAWQARR